MFVTQRLFCLQRCNLLKRTVLGCFLVCCNFDHYIRFYITGKSYISIRNILLLTPAYRVLTGFECEWVCLGWPNPLRRLLFCFWLYTYLRHIVSFFNLNVIAIILFVGVIGASHNQGESNLDLEETCVKRHFLDS